MKETTNNFYISKQELKKLLTDLECKRSQKVIQALTDKTAVLGFQHVTNVQMCEVCRILLESFCQEYHESDITYNQLNNSEIVKFIQKYYNIAYIFVDSQIQKLKF